MLNSLFRYEGQRTAEALAEYVNSEAGKLVFNSFCNNAVLVGIKSVALFMTS
jgi:hypothetical protein